MFGFGAFHTFSTWLFIMWMIVYFWSCMDLYAPSLCFYGASLFFDVAKGGEKYVRYMGYLLKIILLSNDCKFKGE